MSMTTSADGEEQTINDGLLGVVEDPNLLIKQFAKFFDQMGNTKQLANQMKVDAEKKRLRGDGPDEACQGQVLGTDDDTKRRRWRSNRAPLALPTFGGGANGGAGCDNDDT